LAQRCVLFGDRWHLIGLWALSSVALVLARSVIGRLGAQPPQCSAFSGTAALALGHPATSILAMR